jgi:hypothetical protein
MTLTELCERHEELSDVDRLLEQEDYRFASNKISANSNFSNLNNRIKQMNSHWSLQYLIDKCKSFREQRVRVQQIF